MSCAPFEVVVFPQGRLSFRDIYKSTYDRLWADAEINPMRAKDHARLLIKYRNKALQFSKSEYALAVTRTQARAAVKFFKDLKR